MLYSLCCMMSGSKLHVVCCMLVSASGTDGCPHRLTTPYMTVTFFPAGKMTNLWDIPLERTCCSSSCFRSRRSCTGVWGFDEKNSPKKLTPASVKQRPGRGMHGTQCRSSYLPRATHVHQQRILAHAVLLHKLDPSPKPTTNEEGKSTQAQRNQQRAKINTYPEC